MQEVIFGILGTGFLTLLGVLIYGLRSDMRDIRADMLGIRREMAEGFRYLGGRIADLGERVATIEGVLGVSRPVGSEGPPPSPALPTGTPGEAKSDQTGVQVESLLTRSGATPLAKLGSDLLSEG
ncbi:MAG: hypothetical protein OXH10_06395 [bacterium]|nr:hypothetical protein [bacterium]MDE0644320.1 hypothetical protein [bacterium]MYD04238.1 hypothetical protein [Acidimicrobiia bacterium]